MDDNMLKKAIISGCNNVYNHKKIIDELNVFPVPDGDTGTNMAMTSGMAAKALQNLKSNDFKEVFKVAGQAMLRGARGNSGVILSLMFRGIHKGLMDKKAFTPKTFAQALDVAVEEVYGAVMNPTEGTMLTVLKDVAYNANKNKSKGFVDFINSIVDVAKDSLNNTPNLLPVLKKAGVVDAGGKGLLVMLLGVRQVVVENKEVEIVDEAYKAITLDPAQQTENEIEFAYCTEFIINKQKEKNDLALRATLESIGDCVVVVSDEDIIKVHTHSNKPDEVLKEGLKYGDLTNIKIDNMKSQHQSIINKAKKTASNKNYVAIDPNLEVGFVAVASGEGTVKLFKELGADVVVEGGQTMNPSTQDILEAIHSVGAKTVIVLPNNKNIIMAAEQSVELADREVKVIQTKTIPQGMASLLAYDSSESMEENEILMTKTCQRVKTGLITFAARDSIFEGKQIGKNEILALDGSKILFTEKDVHKSAVKLMKKLISSSDQFATVLYGKDVSKEQADYLYETLKNKYGGQLEINMVEGGQPVYYYIFSVE